MTSPVRYKVVLADEVLTAAQVFMIDDRDGLIALFDALDELADNPRPDGAFAWGVDRYRLRIGRYRVLYGIAEKTVTVEVIHLGRAG